MTQEREHVVRNRALWDAASLEDVALGERNWASEPTWGIFGVPEADVGFLPDELEGRDVLELGCGTGYVSAWVARRGARPVALDNSSRQLATTRRLQAEHALHFPLIWASGEEVPLHDASFDVAVSEYGVCLWCDPYRWVPEASRLLRPGGELVFLTNSVLAILCVFDEEEIPADETLKRPYFGMHRFEWPDDPLGVEFHLGYGDWVRLLRTEGFAIEDIVEVRPPPDAVTSYPWMTLEWARNWPCEEVWKARKLG